MTGALGTYAAALIVLGASLALGGGIVAACGADRWTWTAPAIGLAAMTVLAWWSVRLPGHATTALIVIAVASALGGWLAAARLADLRDALHRGLPLAALAMAACSIPFVVEGHFGILGTGFNVDMSQHLFAAAWLSDPNELAAPGIYEQGYPLGPHALAAATGGLTGELATAFSGVTIALPVIVALTALAAVEGWSRGRAYVVAAMAAFAYLAASYLAQGSFKELFEMAFLLGFALWLAELPRTTGWTAVLPGSVIAAGALYAYSGPGIAWLAGTLVIWAAIGLVRNRGSARASARRSLPYAAAAVLAILVLTAPELDRIIDFGGSVGTVSEASGGGGSGGGGGDGSRADRAAKGPKFDNDLGNLFGQIGPLEAFGIWPSGDFRVAPGDGAVPAIVFYFGALLGALALAFGVAAAARRGEAAILAALAAAAAIWLAARIGSTPYTTAKALAMISPLVGLIAAKGLLDTAWLGPVRDRSNVPRAAVAVLVIAASGCSAALALANAPVGPSSYSAGVGRLSDEFAGQPTLLIAPADVMADEHGEEFYGWELREASASCVASDEVAGAGKRAPSAFHFVLTVDGEADPPFVGLVRASPLTEGITLWRRADGSAESTLLLPDEDGGAHCEISTIR